MALSTHVQGVYEADIYRELYKNGFLLNKGGEVPSNEGHAIRNWI
jgi:hypothetical protein